MNSNRLTKHVKRKVASSFTMGQNVGTASSSQSSCSIFSVDEDVKFVVDDDSKFSAALPVDKSIELSSRPYSKKNPITYPMLSPSPQNIETFEFSVFSDIKSLTTEALKHGVSKIKSQVKRKPNGKLGSSLPDKILKREPGEISRSTPQTSFTKTFKETKCKTKSEFGENEISSDSDIELIEEVIVNPNALHLKSRNISSRKLVHTQSFSSYNKKHKNISESLNKKCETKPVFKHASKPCFMANAELIVNEADTAPYMPNNPNIFPDVQSASSSPVKWLNSNSSVNSSQSNSSNVIKKKRSLVKNTDKPISLLESKQTSSDRSISSRELKSLYENLNEISWTHKNSFKKLLRNPEYIRHSDRGTAKSGKTGREVKPTALKKAKQMTNLKRSPTLQASLKKTKLARANTHKRLAKLNPSKLTKKDEHKLATHKTNQLSKLNKRKESAPDSKAKMPKINAKVKASEIGFEACLPLKKEVLTSSEKLSLMKNNKKDHFANEKSKNKGKNEIPKMKDDSSKFKSDVKEKMVLSKPKIEIAEASSSGLQNNVSNGTAYYNAIKYSKESNLKKFIHQESLDAKHYEMIKGYEKDDHIFTTVRKGSQCRVQIEPLEHTNLWNTEYYEDFRKQFLQQTLRKAMEKREPNCITSMLQDLCDSYMLPATDDNKSKKNKKPEEETLRSSVRQLECAFRYKEIVVRKMPNYMQVILVPSFSKKNCLSIDAIKELRDAFLLAKKDPKCRAVLINSGGSYFCTGIDLSQLVGTNKKQACEEMASVIRELVLVLGSFSKPVVAAVNGDAYGFGVSLLTYCDVVLASDKATFCIPSTTIGYMPEGGLTLTLPQVIGNIRSTEMLLQGTRITAAQAHDKGLVSDVFWPTNLMHEVIPRVENIIAQPVQVMEATKLLVRANLWDKLKTHMDFERRLIVNQWLSATCQDNMKRIVKGETILV